MNAQTESKPILEQFTVIERAVIYARVSGDDTKKEGRNIGGQLDMGREHCREKGYRIVDELHEDPKKHTSGHEIDLPVLNQIREMAQAGEFDVLVVRELDRLSRNLAKQLIVEEELNRAGVRIEYVLAEYDDTPEGRLQKHIRATVAEYEREKIRERMMRGRKLKAKSGNVVAHGNPPYGYHLGKADEKDTLDIVMDEARVIRLIFEWYIFGDDGRKLSIADIVRKLAELGIRAPGGTRANWKKRDEVTWLRSAVHRILTNETYAGIWHYGKTNKQADGRRVPSPDRMIPIQVPTIVSRELWEAAQERLSQNKQDSRRNTKFEYLMSKRLDCGDCHYKVHGISAKSGGKLYLYYRCPAHLNTDCVRDCDLPSFPASKVDDKFWEWVRSYFEQDSELLEAGLKRYQEGQKQNTTPQQGRLAVVEEMLTKERRKLNRWKDMYADELISKEELVEAKSKSEQAIAALEKERDKLLAFLEASIISDEQIREVVDAIARLKQEVQEGLSIADVTFKEKRWLIERLNVEGTLKIEDGQKVIYARCYLGEKVITLSWHSRSLFGKIIARL